MFSVDTTYHFISPACWVYISPGVFRVCDVASSVEFSPRPCLDAPGGAGAAAVLPQIQERSCPTSSVMSSSGRAHPLKSPAPVPGCLRVVLTRFPQPVPDLLAVKHLPISPKNILLPGTAAATCVVTAECCGKSKWRPGYM